MSLVDFPCHSLSFSLLFSHSWLSTKRTIEKRDLVKDQMKQAVKFRISGCGNNGTSRKLYLSLADKITSVSDGTL